MGKNLVVILSISGFRVCGFPSPGTVSWGSDWVSCTMSRSVVDIGTTAGANLAYAHGNRVCSHFLPLGFGTSTYISVAILPQLLINTTNLISLCMFNGPSDAKSVYFLVFMFSCESGNEQKNDNGLKIR